MANFFEVGDHLVNLDCIRKIERKSDGSLHLVINGESAPVIVDAKDAAAILYLISPAKPTAGLKELPEKKD